MLATAPIWPLAWEPPNAAGAPLEMEKKKTKKKKCIYVYDWGTLLYSRSWHTVSQLYFKSGHIENITKVETTF